MIAAALAFLGIAAASAQKWPEKTVRIVTPFGPGGGTDIFARILAQRLTEVLGQQFIVENRPGAGSTLGTEFVARSAPDGYTLLMTSASFSFSPGLYPKLRYDAIRDFVRVSQVVSVPHVIVVLPSFPARDLQGLIRLARSNPKQVLYASAGPGSAMHLAGALFAIVTRTDLTHVAYKSGGATTTSVMSGEATTAFNTLETVLPLIQAKRLRPLAVSTRERAAALPDVPTAIESGVKGYEVVGWFGLMAPTGTPQAIVDKLADALNRGLSEEAVQKRLSALGAEIAEPDRRGPKALGALVKKEVDRLGPILKAAASK